MKELFKEDLLNPPLVFLKCSYIRGVTIAPADPATQGGPVRLGDPTTRGKKATCRVSDTIITMSRGIRVMTQVTRCGPRRPYGHISYRNGPPRGGSISGAPLGPRSRSQPGENPGGWWHGRGPGPPGVPRGPRGRSMTVFCRGP